MSSIPNSFTNRACVLTIWCVHLERMLERCDDLSERFPISRLSSCQVFPPRRSPDPDRVSCGNPNILPFNQTNPRPGPEHRQAAARINTRAANDPSNFTFTEKAPTRVMVKTDGSFAALLNTQNIT